MVVPDITSVLDPSRIELDTNPRSKEDCIEALLELIDESGRITDREQVKDDLMERERQTTTGVGKGIGIPHAKTTGVTAPTVAFMRSENGVDFGAMDDEPARLIFMLLVPKGSSKDHLKLLSSLSRALIHDEVREKLYDAEDKERIIEVLEEAMDG